MRSRIVVMIVCAASLLIAGRHSLAQSTNDSAPNANADAEQAKSLEQQARLWLEADQFRRQAKPAEWRDATLKLIDSEKALFGGPTHTLLYLLEDLAHACDRLQLPAEARRAREQAVAVQLQFLGDLPSAASTAAHVSLLLRAVAVRTKLLDKSLPIVGLTTIDVALAQESQGSSDLAEKSLQQAIDALKPLRYLFSPTSHSCDAFYQFERMQLATRPPGNIDSFLKQLPTRFHDAMAATDLECAAAEDAEANGNVEQARAIWKRTLGAFQGAGGNLYAGSEQTELAMIQRYHSVVDRFLSFAARAGLPDKDAAGMYLGLSNFKGAIYTHLRRKRLERHSPYLQPFFDADGKVERQLIAAIANTSDAERQKSESFWRLVARKTALEAEISRRHGELPAMMNSPLSSLLPADGVLVDYWVYQYTTLPHGKVNDPRGAGQRLACFVCRPRLAEVYFDIGPLAPTAQAAQQWRRLLQTEIKSASDRGLDLPPENGSNDANSTNSEPPQLTLRKQIWDPVQPYVAKAKIVLISPDGVLATLPFSALPGSKPGAYLLEEYPLAIAPVPRLLKPLPSMSAMMDKQAKNDDGGLFTLAPSGKPVGGALLIGDVDFDAEFAEVSGKSRGQSDERTKARGARPKFPSLPGTKVEVQQIGDLFREIFPDQQLHTLTGLCVSKEAFREASCDHRWLHLATHGYFSGGASHGDQDSMELNSAIVLAGASSAETAGDNDGILTALEVASLDLEQCDLTMLSACETGLGAIQEGEGVQGLQRAFQVAGAKTVVATLWQIDDAASQALMIDFYDNLWRKKMPRLEALRQAQLKMLRQGPDRRAASVNGNPSERQRRWPPYYWAAFVLSGDWQSRY